MHTEVDRIRTKRAQHPWPKYLSSVTISGLRGWTGQEVRFEFPVTVLCGENGSGKSTVLKAAATAYVQIDSASKTFYQSTFFPDTAWESFSNAKLSYRYREGQAEREYTARKKIARWRFPKKRPQRYVIWQDISRTLPLDATVGYASIANRNAQEVSAKNLDTEIIKYYSSIMGRNYRSARFAASNIDEHRQVGIVDFQGNEYSQFHQGAGEDATLDILLLLQNIPDTSLLLIDEVEASLHPRSQRRLVHFLLWLARTKSIQIIMSTHSPYVMEELPPEARIFLERRPSTIDIVYGITPDFALNRMDDINRPELYIFTEDKESATVAASIIRSMSIDLARIAITPVGPANIVNAIGIAANNSRLPIRAIGVLDADQIAQNGCINLPGQEAPERQIIKDINKLAVVQLGNRLELNPESIRHAFNQTMSISDHHQWLESMARATGHTSDYLWETMCLVWSKHCITPQERNRFGRSIKQYLE